MVQGNMADQNEAWGVLDKEGTPEHADDTAEGRNAVAGVTWVTKTNEFFAASWSVAGVKYVMLGGASWIRRILWLLMVLFGLGLMIFQIQDRIGYFMLHPTSILIRTTYKSHMPFPTVTICSENRFSKGISDGVAPAFTALLKTMYPATLKGPAVNISHYAASLNGEWQYFDWGTFYRIASPVFDIPNSVHECTFNGQSCQDPGNFEHVGTSMGTCLQFNAGTSNYPSRIAGSAYGLWLQLNASQEDYLVTNSQAAGFRVLLHTPADVPLVEELGFQAGVGQITSASVNFKTLSTLPEPYGNCNDEANYSYKKCVLDCKHNYIIDMCSCKYFYYETVNTTNGNVTIDCGPLELYNCADPLHTAFLTENLQETQCHCPQQCVTNNYQNSVSSAPLSDYYISENAQVNCNSTPCEENEDIVEIKIYYNELLHEEVTTAPAYTILALLCDIGGALGLVLGATIISLFELVDFVIVTLLHSISYKLGKGKEKK